MSHPRAPTTALGLTAALALLVSGCETDDSPGATPASDAAAGDVGTDGAAVGGADAPVIPSAPDASPADAGTASTPLYLIHTAVQAMSGRTNYFTLVDSLATPRKLDYAQSLELPGFARLYANQGDGFFAIGEGEAPIITRYDFTSDGRFIKGKSVSLQSYGVASMGPQAVLFVGPTKAYYRDQDQNQIIVWDSKEMVVIKTIPLPGDLVKEGFLPLFSQWAERPGEGYFAVGAQTKTYDRVLPGTHLVRIDTASDTVTVTSDTRCRGFFKTARLANTLYFFSNVINGFGQAVAPDDAGQADCFLRIPPGQTGFDPEFVGTLGKAFAANQIATVISVTADGRAWAQVADTTVTPSQPGTTAAQWYSKGWSWAHLPLASPVTFERVPGDPGAYSGNAFIVGSDFFVSQARPDYSESALVNTAGPTAVPGISFAGFALDVSRVR
jgi:hypothetical protein